MLAKNWMMATGSVLVLGAMLAPSVMAQTADDTIETIVVTGIRGSLEKSAAIKRDSKQIVDVITAEDVGKLPDNNVVEALARVTGVQIERSHGEGSSVSIRGMTNISTTLNGNSSSVGDSRSADLSDIPAELLKSVTVYKTRSADQVEGGIAGTVNVDLRRPLDLPEGWTLAGSLRGVNSSIGNVWSPYASVLASDRFQTSIGEVGFLLNVSYSQNSYVENYFYNESPNAVSWWWNDIGSQANTTYKNLSSSMQALNSGYGPIAPYSTYYGYEQGTNTRPSINLSTQWRVSDDLDFVLEGAYFSSKNKNNYDRLWLNTRVDSYKLSGITLLDNTGPYSIIKSATISNGTSAVNGGPQSTYQVNNTDDFNTNLEMHWHHGKWIVNGSAQYNWSGFKYYQLLTTFRFNDATTATVDFDSANGAPSFSYGNVSTTDSSAYDLFQYHDEKYKTHSQEVDGNLDATYVVSEDWYLRNIQVGTRYSDRHTTRNYGYRDAYFYSDTAKTQFMPAEGSGFPCTDQLQKVKSAMKGSQSWYRLSPTCLMKNSEAIRSYILTAATAGTVDKGRYDWSTTQPPDVDLAQSYVAHEFSLAGYAQANWAFSVYSIPVDGQLGVRVVNTWGDSTSTEYKYDASWNETVDNHSAKKDYTDVLPNYNAIVHLADKLQIRLSYYYQIDRPDFQTSSAWQTVQAANTTIYAGNPTLKPMREHNYDASLEYFFGKAGQASLGYYLKKPHGWFYYDASTVSSGTYKGYTMYTTRNANPGTFEGFEGTLQSFFDFLPWFWSNFGASANGTLMTSYKIMYPYNNEEDAALSSAGDIYSAAGTSRYTYNLALYYDTPEFSTRLSYNRRAAYRTNIYTDKPGLSQWNDPTSRLDVAINYTPYKWMTLSLEGANLLEESNRTYWGKDKYLPESVRMAARTIQFSVRLRN